MRLFLLNLLLAYAHLFRKLFKAFRLLLPLAPILALCGQLALQLVAYREKCSQLAVHDPHDLEEVFLALGVGATPVVRFLTNLDKLAVQCLQILGKSLDRIAVDVLHIEGVTLEEDLARDLL